mgnify:CR=1 FL=1
MSDLALTKIRGQTPFIPFIPFYSVLTMDVNITTLIDASQQVKAWALQQKSSYVCVSNVHMCMEVYDDKAFSNVVNKADMVLPDGKPVALALKLLGHSYAKQVRGADITIALCTLAAHEGLTIGLYGGSEQALMDFQSTLKDRLPRIKIGCAISPPFRALSVDEDAAMINQINDSGVHILFVGLGCPKQERWMAEHKGQINAVMLGVGAVFDFLSGNKKEAPVWIQSIGMEWLFRLCSEPRHLWKRYFKHNPRFVWFFGLQLLRWKLRG